MSTTLAIYYLIVILSLLNFGRILMMLIGSDWYDIKHHLRHRAPSGKRRTYRPRISVIIPAYNEETGVIRTLQSVLANAYPNKQIIVVNDGSKDNTLKILRNFQRRHPKSFKIINQANSGKAAAINNAVRHFATGKLVMVLDADSLLQPNCISNMVEHFKNPYVIAASSNVKIIPSSSILGLTQRFEYLISYRMKRALSILSMEYIVGGVGSTFRRSVLLKAGLYDTDTMTEDIDLTVKLISLYGNRKWRIHYAADAITHTEHVLTFRSLIKQRFRWKYGRFQTLLKHYKLLFNKNKKYTKRLTWYQLPYALFGELVQLIEPLLVGFILFVVVIHSDITSLISVYIIVTSFIFLILLGENSEKFTSKLYMSLTLPFMYFLLYILSLAEFIALITSIKNSRALLSKDSKHSKWEHVERSGKSVAL